MRSASRRPRRAEWRKPSEETWGAGRLLQGVHEVASLPSVQVILGLALGGTLCLALFAGFVFSFAHRRLDWVFLGLLALMGVAFRVVLLDRGTRPKPRPSDLLPIPAPEDTFLVHLSIAYRGALTGTDAAVAAFVEGWLHVEGRRTSFSLRAEDGEAEWRDGILRIAFPDGQRLDLWLASGNDHLPKPLHSVLIHQPLRFCLASGNFSSGAGAHFYQAANLWIADRERPECEPILPPLGFSPSARAAWVFALLLGASCNVGLPLLIRLTHLSAWIALLGLPGTLLFVRSVWAIFTVSDVSRGTLPVPSGRGNGHGPSHAG